MLKNQPTMSQGCSWFQQERVFHTFIKVMSMQTPPLGDKV